MAVYEVEIKSVEPVLVASRRESIPDYGAIGSAMNRIYNEVVSYIGEQNGNIRGPGITIWHGPLDAEAALPIDRPMPDGDRVTVRELPGEEMACLVHHGPFDGFRNAYEAVRQWIRENDYRITGPSREVYLHFTPGGDPKDFVTEIQFPVAGA
ncbi:MAG: GyrI-like domain-containing protein [Gemmatimonadota bacterium]|nr:GyrI-like domain-containing protein [Gemmatimonadota bacterium]